MDIEVMDRGEITQEYNWGVVGTCRVPVVTTPLSIEANIAFSPAELEAEIERHTRRIARECPKGQRGSIQTVLDYLGEK